MKKIISALCMIGTLSLAMPAFALFTNGGFEDGNFNGWTFSTPAKPAGWDYYATLTSGASLSSVISSTTSMLPGQTVDINPYYDNYMARLQNLYGNYHATTISQTDTISAGDLGKKLYVAWGALLVEPDNLHPAGAQPAFDISVKKGNTVIGSFHADALNKQAGGWANYGDYGGTAWYKSGVWNFDLSTFAVGDLITVSMSVFDCGWGGHGGSAFLDGIGTTPIVDPNTPVPEPSTIILLGLGLAGAAVMRKRMSK
jgi:hypothetical protein